jgi:hypothetical protein
MFSMLTFDWEEGSLGETNDYNESATDTDLRNQTYASTYNFNTSNKRTENSDPKQSALEAKDEAMNQLTLLPANFRPGPYDVICGRGKCTKEHAGNRIFRTIVETTLEQYAAAPTKQEKTIIVSSIIQLFQEKSLVGGFVREVDGIWYRVSDSLAREKCGQW